MAWIIGAVRYDDEMRYVILRHETPPGSDRASHYDLMLERGGALETWAIERMEELLAGEAVAAEKLTDHRLAYLEYEGPVSGDRGTVRRWDGGMYQWVRHDGEEIVVDLAGGKLSGELKLKREEGEWWTASFTNASLRSR
jgi:hypothetical protein